MCSQTEITAIVACCRIKYNALKQVMQKEFADATHKAGYVTPIKQLFAVNLKIIMNRLLITVYKHMICNRRYKLEFFTQILLEYVNRTTPCTLNIDKKFKHIFLKTEVDFRI